MTSTDACMPSLDQVDDLLSEYRRGESPLENLLSDSEAAARELPQIPYRDQDENHRRIADTAWNLRSLDRALRDIAAAEAVAASVVVDNADEAIAEAASRAAEGSVAGTSGTVIGYVAITDSFEFTDASYECAAWYQNHTVHPGAYPLVMSRDRLLVTYDTVLGHSDFGSRVGGVPLGGKHGIDENMGEPGTYTASTYTFNFPKVYVPGVPYGRGRVFLCPGVSIAETRFSHPLSGIPGVRHEIAIAR